MYVCICMQVNKCGACVYFVKGKEHNIKILLYAGSSAEIQGRVKGGWGRGNLPPGATAW